MQATNQTVIGLLGLTLLVLAYSLVIMIRASSL